MEHGILWAFDGRENLAGLATSTQGRGDLEVEKRTLWVLRHEAITEYVDPEYCCALTTEPSLLQVLSCECVLRTYGRAMYAWYISSPVFPRIAFQNGS